MSDTQAPVLTAPNHLSRRFFPFTIADWVVTGVLVFWAMLLNHRFGSIGSVVGLALLVVAIWSHKWGKTYDRLITKVNDAEMTIIRQGALWENIPLLRQLGQYVEPSWWRRAVRFVIRRRDPYPIRVDSMIDERFGEVGLGYNTRERTDSIVFLGSGSDISTKDEATQFAMIEAFASAVRRMSHGSRVPITLIARPRDADVQEFDTAVAWSHHPDAVIPFATEVCVEHHSETGEWISPEQLYSRGLITKEQERWRRLHDLAVARSRVAHQVHGRETDFAVVITVKRDPKANKAARSWKPQPLDPKAVRQLPLTRIMKIAHVALQNLGVEGLRLLDRQEMEKFCADRMPLSDELQEVDTGVSNHHPQLNILASRDAVVEDGVMYATYRVEEMPTQLFSDSIARLFTLTSPTVSLAVRGENTRGSGEARWLYWITSLFDGLTGDMRLGKSITHSRAQLEEISDRIADTRDVQRMTILLRLAGTDAEQFVEDADTLVREAAGLGFMLELVPGSSLQYQAKLVATTGMASI